jgi:hypothetical protein
LFNPISQFAIEEGLVKLYGKVPFDGVWIDKNEPMILCDGGPPLCQINQTTPNKTTPTSTKHSF